MGLPDGVTSTPPADDILATNAAAAKQLNILLYTTIVFLSISTISVVLRIATRCRFLKKLHWDDYLIILAQILYVVTASFSIRFIQESRLLLTPTLPPLSDLENTQRYARYAIGFYALTIIVAKISLAAFFLAFFSTPKYRFQRYYIYGSTVLSSVLGFAYLAMAFGSCAVLESTVLECSTTTDVAFAGIGETWSIFNALTDLAFSALAVSLLASTMLPTWTKITTSILLVFGSVGGIASILRVVVQFQTLNSTIQDTELGRWSNIEAGICISCACLATLRPLFKKIRSLAGKTSTGSGTAPTGTALSDLGTSSRRALASIASRANPPKYEDLEKVGQIAVTHAYTVEATS